MNSASEIERVRRRRAGIVHAHAVTHGVAPAQDELSQAREWLTDRKIRDSTASASPTSPIPSPGKRLTGNPVLSEFHSHRYSKRPSLPTAIRELAPQARSRFPRKPFRPNTRRMEHRRLSHSRRRRAGSQGARTRNRRHRTPALRRPHRSPRLQTQLAQALGREKRRTPRCRHGRQSETRSSTAWSPLRLAPKRSRSGVADGRKTSTKGARACSTRTQGTDSHRGEPTHQTRPRARSVGLTRGLVDSFSPERHAYGDLLCHSHGQPHRSRSPYRPASEPPRAEARSTATRKEKTMEITQAIRRVIAITAALGLLRVDYG